ncbi:MAG TPA: L-threonylcarbamoyladenylate synthase [Acidobacteriota bacterium]|jgi:L-threonylcarbamoyladenylate synthase|nr:L-threonylcarbamoyladenylate synthase [Acidobacteriota bacterium]HNT17064.1 L-threonylcarbamoyladenylate synthase [Acidobacteriota bacterium]HPA26076.1 L-threonylcarbamoyladenylate synthase [Acidobacteriota bacterium]HQO19291.1 L-threonylcarbamoyladenylate synthase [Acidobacteriota bacterium]HQQ46103.1 L-threonylcarbamoyladenylate synthase [Acidobacteriota bacterium]
MARVINTEEAGWLDEAVSHIREGKLIVFPTETVYGMGINLEFPENLEHLQRAKGRAFDKPIALMTGSLKIAEECFEFNDHCRKIARKFFPGPLTLVLKRSEKIPMWFFPERKKIGLRIPDNRIALDILNAYRGPLAVSSANVSGSQPARNFEMALFYFANEEDLLIIDGGESAIAGGSTVIEVVDGTVSILRPGPIAREKLEQALVE